MRHKARARKASWMSSRRSMRMRRSLQFGGARIEPLDGGRSRFVQSERFSGLLV
jgi:hypothetical protein